MRSIRLISFVLLLILFFPLSVSAYETYEITESELDQGYAQNLAPGDSIVFPIGSETRRVTVTAVYTNLIRFTINPLSNDQRLSPDEEKNFEVDYDDFYDVSVKLEEINFVSFDEKSARILLTRINEAVDEDDPNLQNTCPRYYTCQDGSRVLECELLETSCLCINNPESLCINNNEEELPPGDEPPLENEEEPDLEEEPNNETDNENNKTETDTGESLWGKIVSFFKLIFS